MVGPYAVPLGLEYAVGVVAIAAGIGAAIASAVGPSARSGMSAQAIAMLLMTAMLATWSWRVITAGGDGANIGGGLAAMLAPFAVAALLFATVNAEQRSRNGALRRYLLLAALAWLTGPSLFAAVWILSR